jgi:hypothetical protein
LFLDLQGLGEPVLQGVGVVAIAVEGFADLVVHDGGEELVEDLGLLGEDVAVKGGVG